MTQLIFAGGGDEAGIPFEGSPIAVPNTHRICLGCNGDAVIMLDLAGATWAWMEQLERAVREVATGDIRPARLAHLPERSPA